MRCWDCGVEPDDVTDITSFDGHGWQIPHWPAGDHVHAEIPPTPEQLARLGHDTLMRIRRAAHG